MLFSVKGNVVVTCKVGKPIRAVPPFLFLLTMKKLFVFILSIVSIITTTKAQTIVVQNNDTSKEQTQDKNIFYINGIPSTQDIGGIDTKTGGGYNWNGGNHPSYAIFKNYNSVTVTVLYQITTGKGTTTGSIVLKPNEEKEVFSGNYSNITDVVTITRKLQ